MDTSILADTSWWCGCSTSLKRCLKLCLWEPKCSRFVDSSGWFNSADTFLTTGVSEVQTTGWIQPGEPYHLAPSAAPRTKPGCMSHATPAPRSTLHAALPPPHPQLVWETWCIWCPLQTICNLNGMQCPQATHAAQVPDLLKQSQTSWGWGGTPCAAAWSDTTYKAGTRTDATYTLAWGEVACWPDLAQGPAPPHSSGPLTPLPYWYRFSLASRGANLCQCWLSLKPTHPQEYAQDTKACI